MTQNTLPKNWAIKGCNELADFAIGIGYDKDAFYSNFDSELDSCGWGIVDNEKEYTIIPFSQFEQYYNSITYPNNHLFWKRLKSFIECVQVHDAMSEEEQDMILNICELKIEQLKN
jgi:hypothetical protein